MRSPSIVASMSPAAVSRGTTDAPPLTPKGSFRDVAATPYPRSMALAARRMLRSPLAKIGVVSDDDMLTPIQVRGRSLMLLAVFVQQVHAVYHRRPPRVVLLLQTAVLFVALFVALLVVLLVALVLVFLSVASVVGAGRRGAVEVVVIRLGGFV